MATDVEIASLALTRIGSDVITSFSSSGNKASRWFNSNYETVKKALLRDHAWNFAIKRVALVATTAPANEYTNAWTLPSDFLRLVRLNGDAKAGYRIESGTLVTDETSAILEYVYDVTDEAAFSADFTDVLAQRLAAEISYYMTDSASTQEGAWRIYEQKLARARAADSREAAPKSRAANLALARLGEASGRQGDDAAAALESAARTIEANIATVRKSLLREYPWNFAVKRVALVATTDPVNDYGNRFTLPADCLRVIRLNASTSIGYRVEGLYLSTDEATATIEYIADVTDEDNYDAAFLDLMAQRLAAEAAVAVNPQGAQAMWRIYEEKLARAKATDGRESAPRKIAANLALLKLGEVAGRAGEDASIARENASRVVEALWDTSRKSLLREHAWNFAVKRATLSSGGAGSGEFSYTHSLPSDFIRAVRINNGEDAFRIEGASILSNLSSYSLEYVYDVTDETVFDAQFQEVLAQRIAAEASVSLNPGAANAIWTVYQQKLSSARAVDGREARPLKKACGLALLKLGDVAGRQGDDALTARETATRTVEGLWDSCRAALLREHPWNFAVKRASLSSTTTPVNDYAYAYTLPSDFVRMVRLNASSVVTWRVEGAKLLTDAATAVVEYVYSVTDEALFDVQFSELLAQRIAAEAAAALNPGAASALWTVYQQKLSVAREIDGREAAPRKAAANMALLKLGDVAGKAGNDAIAAREAAARTVEGLWDTCRKALLREHPWNFATKYAVLVVVSGTQYSLPSDFIRAIRLNTDGSAPFQIVGSSLYTSATSPQLEYVYDVTDEALFDPQFSEVLAQRIAAEAAASINPGASGALWTVYQQKLQSAITTDTTEAKPYGIVGKLAESRLGEVAGRGGAEHLLTREKVKRTIEMNDDYVRKTLLREHPWNFAIRRAVLTRDTIRTITAITAANPVVVTSAAHGFANGATVYLDSIVGMTELNGRTFTVANQATNTFELSGEDGTDHTAYSSGGFAYAYIAKEYRYRFALPADCLRLVRINGTEADEYRLEGGYIYTDESSVYLEYVADISDESLFDSSFTDVFATRLAAEVAVALNPGASGALWASYEAKMRLARTNNAREGTPRGIDADTWLNARN